MTPAEGHGAFSWHGVWVAAEELLQVPQEPEPLLGHPSLLATAGPWGWTTTLLNFPEESLERTCRLFPVVWETGKGSNCCHWGCLRPAKPVATDKLLGQGRKKSHFAA